jgi:hypothetical protein
MPRPVRRRRPLLVAVAVLLGLVVWLVIATGLERASERVQVWSVAAEVSRGEAVEQAHLVPSEVAVSDRSAVLEVTDVRVAELAGGLWAADLSAGALISPGLIVERLEVGAGEALVGLALPPGGWPSASLRSGDTVMVVGTGDASGVLVDRATVDSITLLGDAVSGTRLVTVAVAEDAAAEVAAAAASGEVALAVVP